MTVRERSLQASFETLDQFCEMLDADWTEMAQALPEEETQQLIDEENEIRRDADAVYDDVEHPIQIAPKHLQEHLQDGYSMRSLVEWTLDAREQEYVITTDVSLFRVVELKPEDDDE